MGEGIARSGQSRDGPRGWPPALAGLSPQGQWSGRWPGSEAEHRAHGEHTHRTSAPCPVSDLRPQRPDFRPSVVTRPDLQTSKREGRVAPAGQGPGSQLSNGSDFPAQALPPAPPVLQTEGPRGCTGPPRCGHAPTPGPPCGPSWALAARLHPTRVLGRESRGRREEGGEAATGRRSRDEPCGHPPRTPEPRTPEPRQQIQGQGALCRWTLACQASPGPDLPELSCTSPTGAQLSPAAPGSPTASGAEARGGMGASPPGVPESTRGPSHGQLVPGGHFSALSGAGIAA